MASWRAIVPQAGLRIATATLLLLLGGIIQAEAQPLAGSGKPDGPGTDTTLLPVPGALRQITRRQDSAYQRLKALPGTPDQKLEHVVSHDSAGMIWFLDSIASTPQAVMLRNLAFNARDWQPTEADRARREDDILRSQDYDYIFGGRRYLKLASIPMSDIFTALGLKEDVTPRITYTVTSTQHVTVIIYTLSAVRFVTVVDADQAPGTYRITWDMKSPGGQRAASGDYVAEVIVGNTVALRKRIEVP